MSRSNVLIGAPWSCAAAPPTTMNSTPWAPRTARSSRIWVEIIRLEGGVEIDRVLQHVEPLARREAQHPVDEAEVDPVLVVDRPASGLDLRCLGLFLGAELGLQRKENR